MKQNNSFNNLKDIDCVTLDRYSRLEPGKKILLNKKHAENQSHA